MPFIKTSSALYRSLHLSLTLSLGSFEIHPSDHLGFGFLWDEIRAAYFSDELEELVLARRAEIRALKEHWRPHSLAYAGMLTSIQKGAGAAYLFCEEITHRYFIAKPVDEDVFCLNNHKYAATPFNDPLHRVCDNIPLYRSAQTEVLAYEIARAMDLAHITPKTMLATIASHEFFDIADSIGLPDKEKLCSLQEYLDDTEDFWELVRTWLEQGLTDQQIEELIDPIDYEDLNIFMWVILDNDGHADNMRAYLKSNGRYGLKKIDNGLSFPEKNAGLYNFLAALPQAQKPLSLRAKKLISALPVDVIIETMHFYEMDACIEAFKERVVLLQQLVQEDLSIAEIDDRLCRLAF